MNKIKKICVIGSGVMGSGIAALIANSSYKVILLDILDTNSQDRNGITNKAFEKLLIQKPPPLSHPSRAEFISIGNLEDDIHLISECDLVIEVIVEKIEIKYQLYKKILPYIKHDAVLASNTSTLPLKLLKVGLPQEVKSRFVITHFFNPPRYMELLELITDHETDPKIIDRISKFIIHGLGKTIVRCNDTPGFIANRVGCFLLELVVRKTIQKNLDPLVVDRIFTNLFGLPSTAIFGLYDLIGHDVMQLISSSLIKALPKTDRYKQIYLETPILDQMTKFGLIGRKGNGGFYRMSVVNGKKVKEVIKFSDLSYTICSQENSSIGFSTIDDLLNDNSNYGVFFNEVLFEFYTYIYSLIPSVTNNPCDIDRAIKLGYSWKVGPYELLENNIGGGVTWLLKQANIRNIELPIIQKLTSNKTNIDSKGIIKVILSNNDAKLCHYQDSLVFSINTKMNCLTKDTFILLIDAVEYAENNGKNLYIHSKSKNFSAGADLKLILSYMENKNFKAIDELLLLGQKAMMRLKYSSINIISCPLGAALGGGCEILLHSDFIVGHSELNTGLVELSVGLFPSFGGTKEMFLRSLAQKDKLIKNLNNIIISNKSTSADYFCFDYGIENLQIVMNKDYLLEDALKLDLPKKITNSKTTLDFPTINLANELDTSNYNDLQRNTLVAFQEIINLGKIDEIGLLEFERKKFLDFCQTKDSLNKLKALFG